MIKNIIFLNVALLCTGNCMHAALRAIATQSAKAAVKAIATHPAKAQYPGEFDDLLEHIRTTKPKETGTDADHALPHYQKLETFLTKAPELVNVPNENGQTVLMG